jgi:hypothetical protein
MWGQIENTVNTTDVGTDREHRQHNRCGDRPRTPSTRLMWGQTENTVNTTDVETPRTPSTRLMWGQTENTVNTKDKREKDRHKDKEIKTVRDNRQHTVPCITSQ